MSKTVVFGADGQLGKDLVRQLPGEVVPMNRREVDLLDHAAVRERLLQISPQVIINCAAYNLVDQAEKMPDPAFAVNTWAVKNLALIGRELNAKFVQFSSDYVFGFDETRCIPFTETDLPGPVSNYGLSKLAGEHAIRSVFPEAIIIRTCGLYGLHGVGGKGGNFVETMKRIGKEKGKVRVVNDQRCTPTSTISLSQATLKLLSSNASGLFHVTNSGDCTWYEFAQEIFRLLELPVETTAITSKEFAAPARRPSYSVLNCDRFQQFTNSTLIPWREALKIYLNSQKTV